MTRKLKKFTDDAEVESREHEKLFAIVMKDFTVKVEIDRLVMLMKTEELAMTEDEQ